MLTCSHLRPEPLLQPADQRRQDVHSQQNHLRKTSTQQPIRIRSHRGWMDWTACSLTAAVDLNLGCKGLWVMPPEHGFPLNRGWSDVNKRVLCGPTWTESWCVTFREVGAARSHCTPTEEEVQVLLTASITSWFNFPCLGVVWETQWTSSESLPADTRVNTYAPPELWAQTLVQFLELLFYRKRKQTE